MKTKYLILMCLVSVLFLYACTAGPNPSTDIANPYGDVAGFWMGLWHGLIAPITFFLSLFSDKLEMYEVFNNGGWYNFGFILGASSSLGGGGASASYYRR